MGVHKNFSGKEVEFEIIGTGNNENLETKKKTAKSLMF